VNVFDNSATGKITRPHIFLTAYTYVVSRRYAGTWRDSDSFIRRARRIIGVISECFACLYAKAVSRNFFFNSCNSDFMSTGVADLHESRICKNHSKRILGESEQDFQMSDM
jgi:hypothetical protein